MNEGLDCFKGESELEGWQFKPRRIDFAIFSLTRHIRLPSREIENISNFFARKLGKKLDRGIESFRMKSKIELSEIELNTAGGLAKLNLFFVEFVPAVP